jgi:DNA-binding PadR family transcriptional regulator
MGRAYLTYATATILRAIAEGRRYGFDIIDATGLPGGTVYPALRRLEDAGHLTANWEKEHVFRAEPRPPRRYYELTRSGRALWAEAAARYRLADAAPVGRTFSGPAAKARLPKPSRS